MKLKDVKIVFIDIDGTLVNDNKEITESTKQSIKRVVDMGIHVVITSGRDLPHTIQRSQNANASSIVIATNGSEIFDYSKDKYIYQDIIDFRKVTKMWNYCMENKIGIVIKTNKSVYYNDYSLIKNGLAYKMINNISECKEDCAQLLIMSKDSVKIEKIIPLVEELELSITSCSSSYIVDPNRNYYSIDVNNQKVSKGTGIKKVLEYLDIKQEKSLCFGDFINDIDMFKECGITVAMGNAVDEIKKVSDYVTDSNNENGVATFLNKYL